jgi:membrane-bound lytic murein transglycosylase A
MKLRLFWLVLLSLLLNPSWGWTQEDTTVESSLPVLAESITESSLPLELVEIEPFSLGIDNQLWGDNNSKSDRDALIKGIDQSLKYLSTPTAAKVYQEYPISEITLDRVRRSLIRFQQLLRESRNATELQTAVEAEFNFYRAIGRDNQGQVLFTGYFEPVYRASLVPTPEYPYPLYGLPPGFSQWKQPHPTRVELEGKDGLLGKNSPLSGQEIVWLSDRLEAYLVQVQGSARLELTDGSTVTIGYAGRTEYPYVSLGRELVKDGHFKVDELSLPIMIDYFRTHREALNEYISRNNRFIFFKQTNGSPAIGSLNVPLTAQRSIATDKSLMPHGALALIRTYMYEQNAAGEWDNPPVTRYVLDQDTGGAIKGPGRVDIFMGSGPIAGEKAGRMSEPGSLYYLLLKE